MTLSAQDFTMSSSNSFSSASAVNEIEQGLVVPVEVDRIISQLDHRLSPEGEVREMRDKLRKGLNRAIVRRFQDSLSVMDMSIEVKEDMDMVGFIYNGLDLRYADLPEPKAKKRSALDILKRKRKDRTYKGAEVELGGGQLQRRELNSERYMAASFPDDIVVDHLANTYPYSWMLVITQMDILKSMVTDEDGSRPYIVRAHYTFIGPNGQVLEGGRVEAGLTEEQLTLRYLLDDTFVQLAQQMTMPTAQVRPVETKVEKDKVKEDSDTDF
jgi:hypothetical protein